MVAASQAHPYFYPYNLLILADTPYHETRTGQGFLDMAAPPGRPQRTFTIFEGTSEIQRLIIARAISGLRLS